MTKETSHGAYIWRGQLQAIQQHANENRAFRLLHKGSIDELSVEGEMTRPRSLQSLLREAVFHWGLSGYPLLSWNEAVPALKANGEPWSPVVGDSTLVQFSIMNRTTKKEIPELANAVRIVRDTRGWLGKGHRTARNIPARVTLAIVHAYMMIPSIDRHPIVYVDPIDQSKSHEHTRSRAGQSNSETYRQIETPLAAHLHARLTAARTLAAPKQIGNHLPPELDRRLDDLAKGDIDG